jgi:hypothetical protein
MEASKKGGIVDNMRNKKNQSDHTISIITLKVRWYKSWSCEIELKDTTTLEDVHNAIQTAVNFDNNHLYEFYIGGTIRGRLISIFNTDDVLSETLIADLFPLPRDKYLFYMFNELCPWYFKISRCRQSPHPPVANTKYPRVISETGKRPKQYADDDDSEIFNFGVDDK